MDYSSWVHKYRLEVYEKQVNYKFNIVEELLGDKKGVYKLVCNSYNRAVSSSITTLTNPNILKQVFPTGIQNGLSFKQFLYQIKNIEAAGGVINTHIAKQNVDEEEVFIRNYVHLAQFETEIRKIEKNITY
jgi:hypothetical protein